MTNEQKSASAVSGPATPHRRPYRRRVRNILIHKPMQREFSFVLVALLMISTLAVAFVIHTTVREVAMGGGYQFGRISPYEMLSDLSYSLVFRVSCILFATLIVVGFFGVFFLHRVAGPVYRFRQVFLRLNDGEIPGSITLREGDFFTETAVEINRLMKRLEFDRQKAKQVHEKAGEIMSAKVQDRIEKSAQELRSLVEQEYEEK